MALGSPEELDGPENFDLNSEQVIHRANCAKASPLGTVAVPALLEPQRRKILEKKFGIS